MIRIPLSCWGSTASEREGAVAGDGVVLVPHFVATRAITIEAEPEGVWPWLVQMGFGRGGWYSYDWIDNLGRPSADTIHPEWQDLGQGETIPGGPIDFEVPVLVRPGSGDRGGSLVLHYSNKVVDFSLAYEVRPDVRGTRLVSRAAGRIDVPSGRLASHLLELGDGVMVRRQLLNLRERSEGRSPATPSRGSWQRVRSHVAERLFRGRPGSGGPTHRSRA